VIDINSARLDRLRAPDGMPENFEIEDLSVHFTGVCAECRKRN
jgi:hypothetical protein